MGRRNPVVLIRDRKDLRKLLRLIEKNKRNCELKSNGIETKEQREIKLEGFKRTEDGRVFALISTWTAGLELLEKFTFYSLSTIEYGNKTALNYGLPLRMPVKNWNLLTTYSSYEDCIGST